MTLIALLIAAPMLVCICHAVTDIYRELTGKEDL